MVIRSAVPVPAGPEGGCRLSSASISRWLSGGRVTLRVRDGRLRTGAAGGAAGARPFGHLAEETGGAALQQLEVGGERILLAGQAAVLTVEIPGAHAGQQGALAGDAAVPCFGGVEIDETLGADLVAGGCE